jgi:adenylylsulfate kinase-like enzyme
VHCPLELCIERERVRTDRAKIEKLYERAIQGELKIAGYGNPYAKEELPFLAIDSERLSIEKSAHTIISAIFSEKS